MDFWLQTLRSSPWDNFSIGEFYVCTNFRLSWFVNIYIVTKYKHTKIRLNWISNHRYAITQTISTFRWKEILVLAELDLKSAVLIQVIQK